MNKQANDLRANPYVWSGGYPRYAITDDGGALCHKCCGAEKELIDGSYPEDGWYVVAVDTNWEDEDLFCDHFGEQIESTYGA